MPLRPRCRYEARGPNFAAAYVWVAPAIGTTAPRQACVGQRILGCAERQGHSYEAESLVRARDGRWNLELLALE